MSYKLLTDASRGFNDTFNYMIRDGKRYIEEKEIDCLKQELETTKKLLDEASDIILDLYMADNFANDEDKKPFRMIARDFLAKLSKEDK